MNSDDSEHTEQMLPPLAEADQTKQRRRKWSRVVLLCVVLAIVGGWAAYRVYDRKCQDSAMKTTLVWARLAPFPSSARNLHVQAKGSMFTREFIVSFEAPAVDIQAWLQSSPGTAGTQGAVSPDGNRHFSIQAGGGAQFAELTLSPDGQKVTIRAYWS